MSGSRRKLGVAISGRLLVPQGVELFLARAEPKAFKIITTDCENDRLVRQVVGKLGHESVVIMENQQHGRRAGRERDKEWLKASDEVVLFWNGESRRGELIIQKAIQWKINCCIFDELGKPVKFVEWANERPEHSTG